MVTTLRTADELTAGLPHIRRSPADEGMVQLIVRRPAQNQREVLAEAELDTVEGLVGDNWRTRGSSRTEDGQAHPEMQINVMNARVASLVAQTSERWPLAGDQLFVDLDLSAANVPPGTRLVIGGAVLEVTPVPHLGCEKFIERFGLDAVKFVNSPVGRELQLRGINAKVVCAGRIRIGDVIRKQTPAGASMTAAAVDTVDV